MSNNKLAMWFLRVGLAFVFIYASLEIYISPHNFLKYIPDFVLGVVPLNLFLHTFGIAEVMLAIWLLSGWKGEYPSLLSAIMMAGIVAFNMEYFPILFRNVAIGFGAVALLTLEVNERKKIKKFLLSFFSTKKQLRIFQSLKPNK